jgi:hypothetical protein
MIHGVRRIGAAVQRGSVLGVAAEPASRYGSKNRAMPCPRMASSLLFTHLERSTPGAFQNQTRRPAFTPMSMNFASVSVVASSGSVGSISALPESGMSTVGPTVKPT